MDLIIQIQEALGERLATFTIGKIEPTLRTHPLYGPPERIGEAEVSRVVKDWSPVFSDDEIVRVFPTESRQRIALTMLGAGSDMVWLPIRALLATCGDDRLEKLVEACRQVAVWVDRRLSRVEEINLMLLYMLQTEQIQSVS